MSKKGSTATANGTAKTPEQRLQERRDRFVRLAPRRVTKALKAIEQVANLGNPASYAYTDEEATKIGLALTEALESCRIAFEGKTKAPAVFAL
jgi:hypothetical protein